MSFWKIVSLILWIFVALAAAFAAYAQTWTDLFLQMFASVGISGFASWAERQARHLDRAIETEETFR